MKNRIFFFFTITLLAIWFMGYNSNVPQPIIRSVSAPTGKDTSAVWIRATDNEMFAWDTSEQSWFSFSHRLFWASRNQTDWGPAYLRHGQNVSASATLGWYCDRDMHVDLVWMNSSWGGGYGDSISFIDSGVQGIRLDTSFENNVWEDLDYNLSTGDIVSFYVNCQNDATDPDSPTVWALVRERVTP
jgi:hypothetical protein